MNTIDELLLALSEVENNIATVRNSLKNLGLAGDTDKLQQLATKIQQMQNYTGATATASSVKGSFNSGSSGKVFSNTPKGYYSDLSILETPVTNLSSTNIKSGVNIGGIVGSFSGTTTTLNGTAGTFTNSNSQTMTINHGKGRKLYMLAAIQPSRENSSIWMSRIVYLNLDGTDYLYVGNSNKSLSASVVNTTTSITITLADYGSTNVGIDGDFTYVYY